MSHSSIACVETVGVVDPGIFDDGSPPPAGVVEDSTPDDEDGLADESPDSRQTVTVSAPT